jgi:poly-gamma-glutamate capsule biosynthesis protein CapA/YwtB (metallophosphatase superfamily)
MPPEIITWTDAAALEHYRQDLTALRASADVVIASHHWGLDDQVLAY